MSTKKHFFLKLIPPRSTFAMDMTESERAIMQEHIGYWRQLMQKRIALVFGPVMDPAGPYGAGIIAVDSEEQAAEITKNDPAVPLNRYEYAPMLAVVNDLLQA